MDFGVKSCVDFPVSFRVFLLCKMSILFIALVGLDKLYIFDGYYKQNSQSEHGVHLLSGVWVFVTPWTAAHQAPLSMGFWIFPRILEWVAISFSRGSSWPRDWTYIPWGSCTGRQIHYHWATWEVRSVMINEWSDLSKVPTYIKFSICIQPLYIYFNLG